MKTIQIIILICFLPLIFLGCKKNNSEQPYHPVPNLDTKGLKVINGNYLADACDNPVVLRGINMGTVYAVNLGLKELTEIAQTGSNAVRIVLTQKYTKWQNGTSTNVTMNAQQLEPIIKKCLELKMIPILELHEFTGSANPSSDIAKAVNWWVSADIKNLLLRYQSNLIINIANEPENGATNKESYYNAYVSAINTLRNAGYTCPLMIDSYNWAKDPQFIVDYGQRLMDKDPQKGLLFSVHAYWPNVGKWGNYTDAQITTFMSNLKNTGLPIVLGELAWADVQDNMDYAINYKLLMQLCQQHQFGYLVWWWGFYDNPGANNSLSMTNNGLYTGLSGHGKNIAQTDAHSIQKTAKKACLTD